MPPEIVITGVVLGGAINVGAICAFWFRVGANHSDVKNALAILSKDSIDTKAEVKETRAELRQHTEAEQIIFNHQGRFNERIAAKLGIETFR